jgi:hypothetical protein
VTRYEARRWVPRNNKLPHSTPEESRLSTDQPKRSLDNAKDKKNAGIEKIGSKEHDEFPEPRRHNSGAETSRPVSQFISSSSTTVSPISLSKVYSFS